MGIRNDPQTRTTTTKTTMPSFSYETSFTSEFSSSSSTESRMSRATSVSSELDELLYQSFNMSDKDKMRLHRELNFSFRKLLSEVQGAGGFSNGNIPCILLVETLLQLPGSQLLPWLFQVCVCHQDKLRCKVSNRGNKQKELSQEYPKL